MVDHAAAAMRALLRWCPKRLHVTPRGWALLAFGAVSLPVFLATGWHEFLLFAVASPIIIGLCAMFALQRVGVDIALEIDTSRVTVGEDVGFRLVLRAPTGTPWGSFEMMLPVRGVLQRIPLPVPLPKLGDRIDITLHTPPRSCFVVGPASIRHGDPFGFLYHEREVSHSATVHVHPRIVRLPFSPIGSVRDPDGCASGAVVDDDFDFHGLRPYVPGDDLRGVHWLTSARSGNLMVRRYESTVQAVPMVHFTPLISDFSDLEEFELAVSVFASIGVHCVRRHRMMFAEVRTELCPDVRSDIMPASAIIPFLDLCSGITPVDVQASRHRRNAVPHGLPRNISLHCHVVGSRHDAVALRRRCAASSEDSDAVMNVIVRVERGAAASMETHGMVMLFTVGDLDGLRSLWKTVA